jgi:hypothetical protein
MSLRTAFTSDDGLRIGVFAEAAVFDPKSRLACHPDADATIPVKTSA